MSIELQEGLDSEIKSHESLDPINNKTGYPDSAGRRNSLSITQKESYF
jgi:hypothetical protein